MKDFMDARKKRERGEKRKELSPTRRAGIHTPEKKPEREARRDAAYGEKGHEGALRPKKVRKAKALGELGEAYDKDVMGSSQIRRTGEGGRVGADRRKTDAETRRTKLGPGGTRVPAKRYKTRKDVALKDNVPRENNNQHKSAELLD